VALTIGVDIGGTKVLGGVVDEDGTVLGQARRDTPADDPSQVLDRIVDVINELKSAHTVEAVGIGAAGWIDADRAVVQFAPNLAWRDEPLRDEIAARVDLPTVVENDANVAAWAEFKFGAARDAEDSMVMFTVGTGIGGGIVLGGDLVRGAHGIAAELGHVLVVRDGHPCGCGRHGCLEQYASGNALTRFAREAAKADPDAAVDLLKEAGGDPAKLTGPMVTEAAQAGDPVALGAFAEAGYWLGQACADLIQILDPQVIVIGGGVIDAGDLLLAPTRDEYIKALPARAKFPVAEVVAASLGNVAGLVGAADLARHR
jgi:glucokinase